MAKPTLETRFMAIDLLSPSLRKMVTNVQQLGHQIDKTGRSSTSSFLSLNKIITGSAIAYGFKKIVDAASEMQNAKTDFSVLTGSMESAEVVVDRLKKKGAATPFEFSDLADSTKTMMQFGLSADDSMSMLDKMGDISMGNKEKLKGLSIVMGQVSSNGKLMGQDLLQMINQGFNPLVVLAKKGTKTQAEFEAKMAMLRKEMSKGKISFEQVKEAMDIATSSGGDFFEGMVKGSKTFSGQMSTMQDGINSVMEKLGTALLPHLEKIVQLITQNADAVGSWIEKNKALISGGLDIFFGTLSVTLQTFLFLWDSGLLPAIGSGILLMKSVSATVSAFTFIMDLSKIKMLNLIASWLGLNAAFLVSPIGLIVLGFIALIAVGVLLYKNWDYIKQKAGELWKAMTDIYDNSTILQYALKALGAIALIALSPILLPLAAIAGAIYGLYKAWQAVRKYLPSWLGGDTEPTQVPEVPQIGGGGTPGLVSGNQGAIQSQNINTNNRSTLDVNFNNTPPGTTTRQSGRAPGINVNTGAGGSRP